MIVVYSRQQWQRAQYGYCSPAADLSHIGKPLGLSLSMLHCLNRAELEEILNTSLNIDLPNSSRVLKVKNIYTWTSFHGGFGAGMMKLDTPRKAIHNSALYNAIYGHCITPPHDIRMNRVRIHKANDNEDIYTDTRDIQI